MKILFLTQIVPFPPDAGPKVKTYHVLRALVKRGHSITLVSYVRPEEMQHLMALQEICDSIHTVTMHRSRIRDVGFMLRSYLTQRPFLIERDDLLPMQRTVNKLVQDGDYDVIHADQLTMVQFALRGASVASGTRPKVIFDAHNAVWTIVERMKENAPWFLKPVLSIESQRVKQYEANLLKEVDHVRTVTEEDRESLIDAMSYSSVSKDNLIAPITVIPIAVDTQQLQPIKRKPASNTIFTLGTLHYPPNADGIRWFFNEVFPLIRQRIPEVKLTIIGKNPPPDFIEFAVRFPRSVKVTGYVPDLVPFLEESAVVVVPVRAGGGMRVRILEAFAYAMPVVTTTVGLEGIHAQDGKDVIVADTPKDFADAVCTLLEDKNSQDHLSVEARQLAEARYDWQVVLTEMDKVFQ